MGLFDSHAHYDDEAFDGERDSILRSLPENGIEYVVNVGCDMPSSEKSVKLCEKYAFVYAAVGIHPHDAKNVRMGDYERICAMAAHEKVVAIGEVGLDYHYDNSPRDIQRECFAAQLQIAQKLKLPFVVHEREALRDTLDVLRRVGYYNGVMHCFSGSVETAREVLSLGMMLSIGGVVTFKNNVRTAEVARYAPLERIMIETDCPYLTPHPHRGERNSSLFLKHTAQKIADIREADYDEIVAATRDNAKRFFAIK